jgi:hypothetical protein
MVIIHAEIWAMKIATYLFRSEKFANRTGLLVSVASTGIIKV